MILMLEDFVHRAISKAVSQPDMQFARETAKFSLEARPGTQPESLPEY